MRSCFLCFVVLIGSNTSAAEVEIAFEFHDAGIVTTASTRGIHPGGCGPAEASLLVKSGLMATVTNDGHQFDTMENVGGIGRQENPRDRLTESLASHFELPRSPGDVVICAAQPISFIAAVFGDLDGTVGVPEDTTTFWAFADVNGTSASLDTNSGAINIETSGTYPLFGQDNLTPGLLPPSASAAEIEPVGFLGNHFVFSDNLRVQLSR